MTRPNTDQSEALREIVEQLDDMVESIDATSTRVLLTFFNGAVLGPTLRIGWRPVGLELSLHEPGEDADAEHEAAAVADRGGGLDPAALRHAFHMPELSGEAVGEGRITSPHCKRCGHVRSQHRARGAGYCQGVVEHPPTLNTDDPDPPWSEQCGCPGWEDPDA